MRSKNLLLVSALAISLAACNNGSSGGKGNKDAYIIDDKYYDNVEKRVAFDKENELNFDEQFTDRMSDDVWNCIDGAWHTDNPDAPHNGLHRRNLFYTKDSSGNGYLAIKARGFYNKTDSTILGKPEGGGIESVKHLTPGRYEIKMAVMPREGGVSTMWTYCTTTGSEATSQNEIDIEIGGTTKGTQFEHEWCTTWTKKTNKQTDTPDVTNILYLNDGRIHTYTFDWYTSYGDTKEGRVDWFIDGHYIDSISGGVVPDHAMPLWVGIWFPPLWAGNAAFEEDYMIIDEITFTAFDSTQYYDDCRSYVTYNPTKPSSQVIPTVNYDDITKNLNKLSNGNMESTDTSSRDKSYYGWVPDNPSRFKGTLSLSDEHTEGSHSFKLSASNDSEDQGIYLGQTISNSFPGYKYRFTVDSKLSSADSVGNIEITYIDSNLKSIKKDIIKIDSETFKEYAFDITMPERSKSLKIYITAEDGTVLYDNAKLVRVL